jgi:metal-responsive CopG/Arc/MetJ family transcriptional regulator
MVTQMVRITASVPKYVAEEADKIADTRKLSRSKIVSECLMTMIRERKQHLLEEGYKAMAQEHKDFAKISENAAKEAILTR